MAPVAVQAALAKAAQRAARLKGIVDDVTTGKDKCRDASASPRESSTTASSSQAGSVSPPSTGKQSTASTVPETDDAALSNALHGLKLQKALDMGSPPVTPPAQIRRNNTPRQVLEGSIGDVAILGGGHDGTDNSSRTKGSCPAAMKKVKKHASKKSKKGAKTAGKTKKGKCPKSKTEKAALASPVESETAKPKLEMKAEPVEPGSVKPKPAVASPLAEHDGKAPAPTPGSAETRAYVPCPKTSVPIPKANVPAAMELVKKEKDIPRLPGLKTTTPTSVRMAKAVDQSLDENLARAATQELFEPSELGNGTEYYSPGYSPSHASLAGSEKGNDEEGELGPDYDEFLNSLEDDKKEEAQDSRDSDQVSVAETTKTNNTQKKKKKKSKKEKTPLQKAMHARYMKFSRSIRSRKAPIEIRRAGRAAKYSHAKLQILQEAWEACKGDWKSSSFYKSITQRKTTSSHGARVWLTRQQICKKYGDQKIADCICDGKLADPNVAATQIK